MDSQAWPTVVIFSASSSGISRPVFSSNAYISSTRSSKSAWRSSWKEASIVTCSGSQPRRSTTMFLKSSKLSFCVSISAPTVAAPGPGPRAARAPILISRLSLARYGAGPVRSRRRHAELGHQLHLVVDEVIPLDQSTIHFEDLDELAAHPPARGGDGAHRRLPSAVLRAREKAFDDDVVSLRADVLRL